MKVLLSRVAREIQIVGTFPSIRAISQEKMLGCSFNLSKIASGSRRAEAWRNKIVFSRTRLCSESGVVETK
jgi:hypothetical protein